MGRLLRYEGGTVKHHALEHEINGILSKKERTDLLDGAHTALTNSGHAARAASGVPLRRFARNPRPIATRTQAAGTMPASRAFVAIM